ncbi:MAG: CidA/LrgA family protein [Eubacteriales bacterium]|nr:CidA/LrgA family protein [Eubacteriales bacterium]
MKYVKEFGIILLISFVGELLHSLLPLPVPASIYGLVLLFACLVTGVVKLEQVNTTARYLIEIMPLMFIPAGVGLLDAWGVLQPVLVPVMVITVLSTVIVMGVSGRITQAILRMGSRKKVNSRG